MSSFCCCCCVSYDFREETIFGSSLIPFVLFMLNVSMYVHWFPRRCHCHMMLVYFNSNTTYRTGTAYPSGTLEFTPGINGVHVTQSLVFCVVLCSPLFVPLSVFHLTIVLSVRRFTSSDYPFVIFKLFLLNKQQNILPSVTSELVDF